MTTEETRLRDNTPRDELDLIIREASARIGNNYQKEVWLACDGCGKERWVRLLNGKPRTILCSACARDKKVIQRCLICGKEFKAHRYLVADGYGMYCSLECRGIAQSRRISGDKHPMWKGGKIKRACEECGVEFGVFPCVVKVGKGSFCSQVCKMINQRKRGIFSRTPNKVEGKLISLLKENNLPFKYVGDGEVWLGNRNPDFINANGKKQVIELLGTYWHPLFDGANRIEHYKQYGFDCLAVWEDELKDEGRVLKKVERFVNAR